MTSLVIDRETLPETLLSIMGVNRIRVEGDADRVVLTPAIGEADELNGDDIDPDDYPDTTAYLNAIPGAVETILAYRNLPESDFEEVPEECFHV